MVLPKTAQAAWTIHCTTQGLSSIAMLLQCKVAGFYHYHPCVECGKHIQHALASQLTVLVGLSSAVLVCCCMRLTGPADSILEGLGHCCILRVHAKPLEVRLSSTLPASHGLQS